MPYVQWSVINKEVAEIIITENNSCVVAHCAGHAVIHSGLEGKLYEDIYIGDNVCLASECMVLKGSYLKNNTIVAAHGLVSKKFN